MLFGGSTGGWMSLAQQVFYLDFFGGTWAFCPDPVDFHAFQLLDVYDENASAFYDRGPFKPVELPVARAGNGRVDLTAILRRDWKTLGPRLVGKLHVTMGTKDTFYLDGALHLLEEFLEGTGDPGQGPCYGGSVTWGDNEPHCYTGTPEGQDLMRYHLGVFAEHMAKMAPDGADTSSWR